MSRFGSAFYADCAAVCCNRAWRYARSDRCSWDAGCVADHLVVVDTTLQYVCSAKNAVLL